jgi:hypothetical protein
MTSCNTFSPAIARVPFAASSDHQHGQGEIMKERETLEDFNARRMVPCRRLWELGTPWVQLFGWAVVVVFTAGIYFTKYQAYAETIAKQEVRITALEDHYAHVDQKLDDIIFYFKIPTHQERNHQ